MSIVKAMADRTGKLGIHNDDHVVLYDTVGVFASPRGAFTFKGAPSRFGVAETHSSHTINDQ